jgi:hypothetical protein
MPSTDALPNLYDAATPSNTPIGKAAVAAAQAYLLTLSPEVIMAPGAWDVRLQGFLAYVSETSPWSAWLDGSAAAFCLSAFASLGVPEDAADMALDMVASWEAGCPR